MGTSLGIDYGNKVTNIDVETGIRYGIISANDLPYWDDESEADYGDPHCPKCGNEAKAVPSHTERDPSGEGKWVAIVVNMPEAWEEWEQEEHECADYVCENCEYIFGSESAFGDEPNCYYIKDGSVEAFSDSDRDVWITKSPYYTHAQLCSPCAPGACDLGSPLTEPWDNNKCYCPPLDWFEDEKAPFPVYLVETGECIYTPEDGNEMEEE